jgi:hypothetical protein
MQNSRRFGAVQHGICRIRRKVFRASDIPT